MSNIPLIERARKLVEQLQAELPPEIAPLALQVPVTIEDVPGDALLGGEFEPDLLGLFVGEPHGADGAGNSVPAQIFLFVANINDEARGNPARFAEEVRLTYLHELGHYLGWDEEDLEARGL